MSSQAAGEARSGARQSPSAKAFDSAVLSPLSNAFGDDTRSLAVPELPAVEERCYWCTPLVGPPRRDARHAEMSRPPRALPPRWPGLRYAPRRAVGREAASAAVGERRLVMIMNGASRSVPLSQGEMTLGRGQDCDVSIASPFVSRLHARLCTEGAVTAIIDANSLNGLFVNGVRVRHDILRSGDVISLAGRFDVWFVAAAR